MGLFDKLFRPPGQDRFAKLVIVSMKQAGDRRTPYYVKEEFQIRFKDEGSRDGVINLHNVYAEFCSVPRSGRKDALKMITRSLLSVQKEVPESLEDARPDLLPAVRSRAMTEFLNLQSRVQGKTARLDIPFMPLGEHLAVHVVYDYPEGMQFISAEIMEKWEITFYELMEIARQNLCERDTSYASVGDRAYGILAADNYDSSRVLHADFLRTLKVQGQLVTMVPSRGALYVTGAEDEVGLKVIVDLAEKGLQDTRHLSGTAMTLTADGEWLDWLPPKGHPLEPQFVRLAAESIGTDYANQKQLLDDLHERTATDIFVATFSGSTHKVTGRLTSFCLWSEGVDALLPKTEKVVFGRQLNDQHKIVACAEWSKVQAVVGHLMEDADMYPPRFRVRSFPTEEQLATLGNEPLQ